MNEDTNVGPLGVRSAPINAKNSIKRAMADGAELILGDLDF
jgi:hypothetical protein